MGNTTSEQIDWQYVSDVGDWQSFEPEKSDIFESGVILKGVKEIYDPQGFLNRVCFLKMIHLNYFNPSVEIPIRRISRSGSSDYIVWFYLDQNWKPYNEDSSQQLEFLYQNGHEGTTVHVQTGHVLRSHSIDFQGMTQTNKSSAFVRRVKRGNSEHSIPTMDSVYKLGKKGEWSAASLIFDFDPMFARRAVRYVKLTSGWTILHQAAWWGDESAIKKIIEYGSKINVVGKDGKTPEHVALERGFQGVAELLRVASDTATGLWEPSDDPRLMPSSCKWHPSPVETITKYDIKVSYGGGAVDIRKGKRRLVDSFGRTLVGWDGSYDPPCGMDG